MALLLSSLFVVADRGNYTPFLCFLPKCIGEGAKINVAGAIHVTFLAILAIPNRLGRQHLLVVVADELNDLAWTQIPTERKLALAALALTAIPHILPALVQHDKTQRPTTRHSIPSELKKDLTGSLRGNLSGLL